MFSRARRLKKKEGIEENYITTINTLKSWLKTVFRIAFQKFNLRVLSIFAVHRTEKVFWNNPCLRKHVV